MSEPRTEAGRELLDMVAPTRPSMLAADENRKAALGRYNKYVAAICRVEREAAALAGPGADRLDVERVKRAVNAVAVRHGLAKDPPVPFSVASIFGYSTAPVAMDEEIAAEYAALSRSETT